MSGSASSPVEGSGNPASSSFWRRLAAIGYDAILLSAVLFVLTLMLVAVREGRTIPPSSLWYNLLLISVSFLYFTWPWVHGGQTLGMRAWRLAVMRLDGGRVSWLQASLRFFTAALSWASLGLGFLWCVIDRERLCWHDRASKTLLVMLGDTRGSRDSVDPPPGEVAAPTNQTTRLQHSQRVNEYAAHGFASAPLVAWLTDQDGM